MVDIADRLLLGGGLVLLQGLGHRRVDDADAAPPQGRELLEPGLREFLPDLPTLAVHLQGFGQKRGLPSAQTIGKLSHRYLDGIPGEHFPGLHPQSSQETGNRHLAPTIQVGPQRPAADIEVDLQPCPKLRQKVCPEKMGFLLGDVKARGTG